MSPANDGNGAARIRAQKHWEWARWILLPLLAWGGHEILSLGDQVSMLSERVAVIEANRFTSEDGLNLWRAIGERPLRSEVPPEWFLQRVNGLEGQLKKIETHLREKD